MASRTYDITFPCGRIMDLSQAQKMIRFAYSSMCDQFGLDELAQLQEFLSSDSIADDYLLSELEDFVAAKLDTKLEPWVRAAKRITGEE